MKSEDRPRSARLLPAPFVSALLLALWLLLNQSLDASAWLIGALLGIAIPAAVAPLRPVATRVRAPRVALRLLFVVLADVARTNWQVARGVLRGTPPRGKFIVIPLDLHEPSGLAVLAVIMCLTPDTLWAELSLDRKRLMIHVFDLHDEAAYIAEVKARYEQPLMEIFQ